MGCLYAENFVPVRARLGYTLDHAIEESLELSKSLNTEVRLSFNGTIIPCHYREHTVKDRLETYFK